MLLQARRGWGVDFGLRVRIIMVEGYMMGQTKKLQAEKKILTKWRITSKKIYPPKDSFAVFHWLDMGQTSWRG